MKFVGSGNISAYYLSKLSRRRISALGEETKQDATFLLAAAAAFGATCRAPVAGSG
jgi:hypothetical protein